jgi:DNA-binding CsgD family transcriptional regulator
MNYLSIFLYIFAVSISFITIYISFKLHKKYQLSYLSIYLYFLISINILGFFNLIGRYLTINLLHDSPRQTVMLLSNMFGFLNFPFVVLSIYLFFYLMRSLLEKEAWPLFNKLYFIFWVIIFLTQVLLTKNYFDTKDDRLLKYFYQGLNLLAIISFCLIALYLLLKVKGITEGIKKKALRNFGLIYLLCFVFIYTVTSKYILPYLGSLAVPVVIFLFFTQNLPALLYLKHYLDKYYVEPQIQLETEADLKGFFSKHEISKREQEIIVLMLKGKSNSDIEKELFISLHTVKNHIYNIYQKLGVKNRLQINNLIRNYLQSKK